MITRRKTGFNRVLATMVVSAQIIVGIPLCLGGGEASAQAPAPRVWLAPIQAKQGVAGANLLAMKFDEVSRGQLRKDSKVEMSDQGLIGPIMAGDSDPRIEQAERLRVAGKEAFAGGQLEKSLEHLKAALQRYEQGLPSIQKLEVVLETLGYLGAVSVDAGFEADAKDYFRRVVAMAPDAEPLDEYSDKAKAYFAKVKGKLLRKKRGNIRVTSVPSGALVKLNGVEKGKTPLTLKRLVRGYHYIQVEKEDAGLAAVKVRVKSKRTAKARLKLSTNVGPEAPGKADPEMVRLLARAVHENRLDDQFTANAAAIGKTTRCDYVVVGSVEGEGNGFVLNAFIYGLKEQQVVALDRFKFRASLASALIQAAKFAKAVSAAAQKFPFEKALAGGVFVKREVAPPPPPPAPVTPAPVPVVAPAPAPAPPPVTTPRPTSPSVATTPPPPPPRPEPPAVQAAQRPAPQPVSIPDELLKSRSPKWYKSWWFWSATGAVVVGGAVTGAILMTQDSQPADRFDVEVTW